MKKTPKKDPEKTAAEYYALKRDAVEDLVNAGKGDTPEYSREELEKYRSRKGIRIPNWLKMIFLKAWFYGAVCFFFLWGLGTYVTAMLDMLFVMGIAMGIVTDLLLNNMIRFFEKTEGENAPYLMFPKKSYASFFLNILYAFVILLCVYMTYSVINYLLVGPAETAASVPLGVEPFLFGIFCMGYDMLFLGLKRLMGNVLRDARENARRLQ